MRIVLAALVLTVLPWSLAEARDLTDPNTTCTVIGQMIQDMALGLGNVIGNTTDTAVQTPASAQQLKLKNQKAGKSGLTRKRKRKSALLEGTLNSKVEKAAIVERKDDFTPQTHRFKGAQIWGEAEATAITAENSFDLKISCTLPVNYWALYAPDGTTIDSGRVKSLTAFFVNVKELYNPPYTLTLNVMYLGMGNQIKVEMKK